MLRIQFHRLYLEDPFTHGKVREPLHRHRDLPAKSRSCLAYRASPIKWCVLRPRLQVTQVWYKTWYIWATKHPSSLQAAWPGTCWEAPCEPIIPALVLMPREQDRGHRTALLQTLHHVVCCSGSFWAQGGTSVLKSSWMILLLWISPDSLLHPYKLSSSSVSMFCSSAPRELMWKHENIALFLCLICSLIALYQTRTMDHYSPPSSHWGFGQSNLGFFASRETEFSHKM